MASVEPPRTLMDFWLDAQRQTWQRLYGATEDQTPSSLPQMIAQWQQAATQGFTAWLTGADPFAQVMSRQLMSAQTTMLQVIEQVSRSWQDLTPRLAAGEDQTRALREAAEQLRHQFFPEPATLARAVQESGELWRLYLEEMQQLARPWAEALHRAPGAPPGGSALMELTSLYWDAYERSFGRLLESPRMGFSRELEEKVLRGFEAWAELRRASAHFQLVVANIWTDVFEEVLRGLAERAQADRPIQSLHELLQFWTGVADRQLEAAFSGETFLQAQRQLFNAAMRYRLHEQQIVEFGLRASYVPTRSEIDEVHRNVYELRKEVRALRKELREARETPARRAPTRKKTP